ncbi:GGDEF domain-containing response regulator [Pseudodesulfovibrio tunisiensis]|uniref:GGDEF domain-containing response regulator n=1 Tax=Pseudodesulfovibrio tunisiensis TaxID=463192 RepID=UPI001FB452F2|nr:diguanylate cyclase [Pseudodesulfovibrio tunisiensis]
MSRARRTLSVLVVQQEDYERKRLAELLSGAAAEVRTARDGREGLNRYHAAEPDILVTDILLPRLDGLDLIRAVRRDRADAQIIATFGPYNPKTLLQAVECDVQAFLRLPVNPGRLLAAVRRCARNIAMHRRLAQADYSLRHMLDLFPGPALLARGNDVVYANRRICSFFGHADHEAMSRLDLGIEDFLVSLNHEPYSGLPGEWIDAIVNDPLDREHVVQLENPRTPSARPSAFAVTFNPFPDSDLRVFTFQDVSELEEEKARLRDEASTDPLTRALNRRSFLRLLDRHMFSGKPFSLIMFDIDHFKSINDTYGHDVGDAVLREISALVRENIRETDTLARWGGEEFMVLAGNSAPDRAAHEAERLRSAVAEFAFTGVPGQITSSFGVARHVLGEDQETLLKRVDQALYQAKENGRNRIVLDEK